MIAARNYCVIDDQRHAIKIDIFDWSGTCRYFQDFKKNVWGELKHKKTIFNKKKQIFKKQIFSKNNPKYSKKRTFSWKWVY